MPSRVGGLGCVLCCKTFPSQRARQQHNQDSPAHSIFRCPICNQQFLDSTAFIQHCSSPRHRPLTPSLQCPRCHKGFPGGPSGLIMHLESNGWCASRMGVDRERIRKFVMAADTQRMITHETILLAVHPPRVASLPAETADNEDEIIELHRHICPKCPSTRGQFTSAQALADHLNSPVHDAPIYKCPDKSIRASTAELAHQHRSRRSVGLASISSTGLVMAGLTHLKRC
ncbi:uncharacterized protein EV422DRAFT_44842 [Fimicolochytrium jonesii]|uniref:uncharacterized protein n=1 Tax=Fimicolochytrium jonesii TaxID=1396493 RepID=UPI0022FDFFC1|nr:uncharacterized protein EV422DRAFT_44842 [Fimicolochytrium jonesii]KAI8821495.1 hypothetical protein EV422DRAFT_44842 [Fimicolochytrium jonesii]